MLVLGVSSSKASGELFEVLVEWSKNGLILPFVWCDASEKNGSLRSRMVVSGEVTDNDIGHLLANSPEKLTVLWLSLTSDDSDPIDDVGHYTAETIRELLESMNTDQMIHCDTRVMIPHKVGAKLTLIDDAYWPNIVYWAPEDRSAPNLTSALLPELVAPYGANAVASVGNLWRRSEINVSEDVLERMFGSTPNQEHSVVMARSFTRILEIPTVVRSLIEAISDQEEVPRPDGGQFDRQNLDFILKDLAEAFVTRQIALKRSEPNLLSPVDPEEIGLWPAVIRLWNYLLKQILFKPIDSFEKLLEEKLNKIAESVEKMLPGDAKVKRWRAIAKEVADTGVESEHHVYRRVADDGPVNELWSNLWRSSLSLIDGSDFDWGVDGILKSSGVRVIATTRTQIVEPPLAIDSRNLKNLNGKIQDAGETGEAAVSPGFEDSLTKSASSLLCEVRSQLELLLSTVSKEHEALSKEEAQLKSRVNSLELEESKDTKGNFFGNLWKSRHRKKTQVSSTTIRENSRRRLRQTLLGGSAISLVGASLITIFASPVAGMISFFGLIFGTFGRLIRQAFSAMRAERDAVNQEMEARIAKANHAERLATLAADIPRFERRLVELNDWERVISLVVHSPWSTGSSIGKTVEPYDWPRPLSVVKGDGLLGEDDNFKLINRFARETFKQGWLTRRFQMLRDEITEQIHDLINPSDDSMSYTPESDTSSDPDAPRKLFSKRLEKRLYSEIIDPDLIERIKTFLGERTLDEIVGDVRVAYPARSSQEDSIPSLRTELLSPGAFFSDLRVAGRQFLEKHWAPSISLDVVDLIEDSNSFTIGEETSADIDLSSISIDSQLTPRVVVSRFEFSSPVPFNSLLSSIEENPSSEL